MGKGRQETSRVGVLQGTLDMLILQILVWGPRHGHGIGEALRARSGEALRLDHGSLYPALHRLEEKGWLAAEWLPSEANRRAKYYRLTAAGKRQLAKEQSRWRAIVATIARVMDPAEET